MIEKLFRLMVKGSVQSLNKRLIVGNKNNIIIRFFIIF